MGAVIWDLAHLLPRLRMSLDFMPSPSPDHPGLFIRDPYRFSDAMLIIPPLLVECLECFDGRQTDLDLRAALVKLTNDLDVSEIERSLIEALSTAGFLEDENFARMEAERRRSFAEQTVREPSHAGSAYPEEPEAMRETMAEYMDHAGPDRRGRPPVRHRGSACEPAGRLAKLSAPRTACYAPSIATARL